MLAVSLWLVVCVYWLDRAFAADDEGMIALWSVMIGLWLSTIFHHHVIERIR